MSCRVAALCTATKLFLPVLALLTLATTASAQESDLTKLSLEDLLKVEVAGASKYLQKSAEAPASVSIITSDEIARFGYRTFSELLNGVRGFWVNYDRNYSYAGTRGFGRPGDYNTRILFLIDGHRLNDNIYDGAYIGTDFPLDLDLIDRVEIIRGPGSSVYGTNAFFAVVNVITKRGVQLSGAEAAFEYGSLNSFRGRMSFGRKFRSGFQMLVSGTAYASDGNKRLYFSELDSPVTNNGIAENVDGDEAQSLFTDFSFRNFRLQGLLSSRKKQIPTGAFGTYLNDRRNKTRDIRGYLDLTHERRVWNDAVLTTRLAFDRYQYDGTYIADYSGTGIPPFTPNQDFSSGTWWTIDTNLTKPFLDRHKATVGFEYRSNPVQLQRNYDPQTGEVFLDVRQTANIWAIYAQDEVRLYKNLILNAGVRYDHYDLGGQSGTLNPRAALIYQPRERTTFKFLYGQAFRAPNSYEMFYGSGTVFLPNPNLSPEKVKTGEVLFEQGLWSNVRLITSGYIYGVSGLISQTTTDTGQIHFVNLENVLGKGIDVKLEARLKSGLIARVGHTIQRTINSQTKDVITNSPTHMTKMQLSVPIGRRDLFASVEGAWMSARRTVQGGEVAGHFAMNVTLLQRRLWEGFDFSAGVYNLFNKRYFDPGAEEHAQNGIQQNGRTFRLKLQYQF